MQFIDIHSHFLPAIDDGPNSLEETVQMLKVAHDGGTRAMVATPHMFLSPYRITDVDFVQERFDTTVANLRQIQEEPGMEFLGRMEFFPGSENYVCSDFLEAVARQEVLPLNGSHYLLIEFPLNLPPRQITFSVDHVRGAGFVPVVAHVERYGAVRRDPGILAQLLEAGCLTQVNADSFDGSFWSKNRRFALGLAEKNLVSIVASDGHGAHHRPPFLMETYLKLVSKLGEDAAQALFQRNPNWVVTRPKAEEPVPPPPPE